MPGLQKLGQVIARNRHLRPALRNALARLENGIRDVEPQDIRTIIQRDLGPSLGTFAVTIAPTILSEASVSAVVRFTWRNPATGRRERGVFKVLKPHIQEYFAEDIDYLQGLAQYFEDQHHKYEFPAHVLPDTFKKVRRLLQHEVDTGMASLLPVTSRSIGSATAKRSVHLWRQETSSRSNAAHYFT